MIDDIWQAPLGRRRRDHARGSSEALQVAYGTTSRATLSGPRCAPNLGGRVGFSGDHPHLDNPRLR
jgi:hypothetical protein